MLGIPQDVLLLITQIFLIIAMGMLTEVATEGKAPLEHTLVWDVLALFDGAIFFIFVFFAPLYFAVISLILNILLFFYILNE